MNNSPWAQKRHKLSMYVVGAVFAMALITEPSGTIGSVVWLFRGIGVVGAGLGDVFASADTALDEQAAEREQRALAEDQAEPALSVPEAVPEPEGTPAPGGGEMNESGYTGPDSFGPESPPCGVDVSPGECCPDATTIRAVAECIADTFTPEDAHRLADTLRAEAGGGS